MGELARVEAHHDVAGLAKRFRTAESDLQHPRFCTASEMSDVMFRNAVVRQTHSHPPRGFGATLTGPMHATRKASARTASRS